MKGTCRSLKEMVDEHDARIKKIEDDLKKIKEIKENYKRLLRLLKKECKKFKEAMEILGETSSKSYRTFFSKRLEEMKVGTFALTADDYFQFWTDLHMLDSISYSKVVSRILPSYWEEPEMQLYEMRQMENIKQNEKNLELSYGKLEAMFRKVIKTYPRNFSKKFREEKGISWKVLLKEFSLLIQVGQISKSIF